MHAKNGTAEGRADADRGAATAGKWRARFIERRLDGLVDEDRPGRPSSVSLDQVEDVIVATLESKPGNATHWSQSSMARKSGLSRSTIGRIWKDFGLQPHRADGFKVSADPLFMEKVVDVVGLYRNPPENAVVLCVDEKSQIQAYPGDDPGVCDGGQQTDMAGSRSVADGVIQGPSATEPASADGLDEHLMRSHLAASGRALPDGAQHAPGLVVAASVADASATASPAETDSLVCRAPDNQALDRSQPVLPMMPGMPERRTHDYYRHGITSLFAAFSTADGTVITELHRQHRATEFRKFLITIDKTVPEGLDIHIVADNYGTHKTPAVRAWLARPPASTCTSPRQAHPGSTMPCQDTVALSRRCAVMTRTTVWRTSRKLRHSSLPLSPGEAGSAGAGA